MSTLDGLMCSPPRTSTLARNMSSPRLTRSPKASIQTLWNSPDSMHSIKQQHFYIEKLRIQRERMELLKTEFEKKDATIQSLNTDLYKMNLMYEEAAGYKRRYDQLLGEYQQKVAEFQELTDELNKARTQIDVFEVELARVRGDADRQLSQIEMMGVELQTLQHRNEELMGHNDYAQKELEGMNKKHRTQIDNIKTKWSDLKSELEELRRENTSLKEQNYRLRHDQDQHKQHLRRIQSQLSQSKTKTVKLQQDLDKTVASLEEQRSNELIAYDEYSQDLVTRLTKSEDRCAKLQSTLKKNKSKYKETQNCIKEVHCRLERQISKAEFLEDEMKNKDALIERYRITQKQQMELVQRLKSELKEHEQNFRKYQRGPEKALRTQLERLRRQLYLLRNAEVDKIQRVFHSFGINDNTRL